MKPRSISAVLFGIFAIGGTFSCATVNDVKGYQDGLHQRSTKPYADEQTAARLALEHCTTVDLDSPFEINITDADPVLVQSKEDGILSNFQLRCISSNSFPEYLTIDAESNHQGGGMGKAFFFVPRVLVYDDNLNSVAISKKFQGPVSETWRGYFGSRWAIQPRHAKKLILLIAADNRSGGLPLVASVSAFAPAIYAYPTGKSKFTIQSVK